MKKIFVNLEEKSVTINNETCNTHEAGLEPNGQLITDVDEITEHFEETNEGEEIEVVFSDVQKLLNGKVVSDEDNNEWLREDLTGRMLFMKKLGNGYFENDCEGEIFEELVPDEVGGKIMKKIKVIKNQDCVNPYELSDLKFTGDIWVKS